MKNIDAYIIGIFMKLAKNKALEMKDIKGQYKIIDKKLILFIIKIPFIINRNNLIFFMCLNPHDEKVTSIYASSCFDYKLQLKKNIVR